MASLEEFIEKEGWRYACNICKGLGFIEIKSRFTDSSTIRTCRRCQGTCIDPVELANYTEATKGLKDG